jgi:hypothetical protein
MQSLCQHTLYGARGILRGGLRGLMSGDPMRLSTPTGEVRKGLWGGGPATGLDASPVGGNRAQGVTSMARDGLRWYGGVRDSHSRSLSMAT